MPPPFIPEASRFAIARAATRRARGYLYFGGAPVIQTDSIRSEAIAVQELRSGLLSFKVIPPQNRKPFLVTTAS